jgi:hypothetical protein
MTGTFLLTLPFLLTLYDAVRHATGTGSPPRALTGLELPYTLFTFLAGYSFGPSVREIKELGWSVALADHWIQTGVIALLLIWLAVLMVRVRGAGVLEMALLVVAPLIAIVIGSGITTKAFNVRYTLPALLGFLGLVSVALHRLPSSPHRAGLGLVLAVFLWADVQWFAVPVYWKEDSRGAARCVARQLPAGSIVAVAPDYMRDLFALYLPQAAGLRVVAVDSPTTLLRRRPRALAVTRPSDLPVSEGELVRIFETHAESPIRRAQAVGYRLYFAQGFYRGPDDEACQLSNR